MPSGVGAIGYLGKFVTQTGTFKLVYIHCTDHRKNPNKKYSKPSAM